MIYTETDFLEILDRFFLHSPYEMWEKWCKLVDDAVGYGSLEKVCKKKGFDNLIRDAIKIVIDYRESKGE